MKCESENHIYTVDLENIYVWRYNVGMNVIHKQFLIWLIFSTENFYLCTVDGKNNIRWIQLTLGNIHPLATTACKRLESLKQHNIEPPQ